MKILWLNVELQPTFMVRCSSTFLALSVAVTFLALSVTLIQELLKMGMKLPCHSKMLPSSSGSIYSNIHYIILEWLRPLFDFRVCPSMQNSEHR